MEAVPVSQGRPLLGSTEQGRVQGMQERAQLLQSLPPLGVPSDVPWGASQNTWNPEATY